MNRAFYYVVHLMDILFELIKRKKANLTVYTWRWRAITRETIIAQQTTTVSGSIYHTFGAICQFHKNLFTTHFANLVPIINKLIEHTGCGAHWRCLPFPITLWLHLIAISMNLVIEFNAISDAIFIIRNSISSCRWCIRFITVWHAQTDGGSDACVSVAIELKTSIWIGCRLHNRHINSLNNGADAIS